MGSNLMSKKPTGEFDFEGIEKLVRSSIEIIKGLKK
jgi:hypothetical protein